MLHLLELRTLGFDIVATDDDPVKECPPSAIFEASRSKLSRICLFWENFHALSGVALSH